MLDFADRPRLRLLLDHFALIEDEREPWRVAYRLPEVLLLAVCGTIAGGDDFDEIVEWGEDNLEFLRRFLPYHHGIPGSRWLRVLVNRIDPALFSACFESWARSLRKEPPAHVALDGKTSRASHDRPRGRAALHLVSAFATRERLVIGQEDIGEEGCEQETIPLLLERLASSGDLKGALVTIDAIACNPKIAKDILDAEADYLLAVKANQSGLLGEIESFFEAAPQIAVEAYRDADKGHGRVEERILKVSREVAWLDGDRRFPGEYRFPKIAAVAMMEANVFEKGASRTQRRFFIASRPMNAKDMAAAIRDHWAIENSLHWVLDVVFREDQARSRTGHGPRNMAVVRHFALNLVRALNDKRSIKLRRKRAGRNNNYLAEIIQPSLN